MSHHYSILVLFLSLLYTSLSHVYQQQPQQPLLDRSLDSLGLTTFEEQQHYDLVVGILSAPQNAAERAACRATWLQLVPHGRRVLYFFVVGNANDVATNEALDKESRTYRDLLRIDLRESYRRLVFKTAAMYDYLALRTNNSQQDLSYSFYLKTDDDSFVRLDKLIPLLNSYVDKTLGKNQRIYWGSQNFHVKRASDKNHKWYDGYYQEPFYPIYALGSAYAMSSDLVDVLGSLQVERRPMFPVEDVATSLWLRSSIGEAQLRRVHADDNQFPLIETGKHTGTCHSSMIVRRHCDDPKLMQLLFDNIHECDDDICCGKTQL